MRLRANISAPAKGVGPAKVPPRDAHVMLTGKSSTKGTGMNERDELAADLEAALDEQNYLNVTAVADALIALGYRKVGAGDE